MKLISALVTLACVSTTFGCASTAEDISSSTTQEIGQGVSVPNPSGAYLASISANGTGCPAGSWQAAISDDGKAFTVTFSAYESVLEPGQAIAIKDCTLALNLKSPEGYSFSVSSFYYQGYAALDQDGMTAKQTARYYFQGNPVPSTEQRKDVAGPYDSSYTFADEIGLTDLVWSPCGASRTLNAVTRLVVQNNSAHTGTGYVNTSSVDGQLDTVFRIGLSWRRCSDEATIPVYRAYNGAIGDHLQGTVPGEGQPGWQPEEVSFRLFADPADDRAPLFRCRVNDSSYHFLSRAADCEGHVFEGALGYVAVNPSEGLVQIFRCVGGVADHLTTANPAECDAAGFVNEGPQGFVAP